MTKNQTLTSDEIQLIQSLNLDPNSDNLKQQIQEILNPTVAAITDSQKPPLERGTEGGVSSWQQEQIYIIGNPPFVGSKLQSKEQRQEMAEIFRGVKGAGVMDYVSAWYIKAGQLQNLNPKIETAFVSTNSISQGEQVGILWGEMFKRFGVEIKFAHRTFAWSSEARGKAQVYVIIIGFSKPENIQEKLLFDYPNIKDEPIEIKAKNINPYLVVADNVTITKRSKPICNVPAMNFGNMPLDGGHLILSDEEKNQFILEEPNVEKFIR